MHGGARYKRDTFSLLISKGKIITEEKVSLSNKNKHRYFATKPQQRRSCKSSGGDRLKEEKRVDEVMMYGRRIPEYYDTMYLDGYTPYEILYATRKKMFREYQEREAAAQRAKQEAERDTIIPTINFKSTVRVIK